MDLLWSIMIGPAIAILIGVFGLWVWRIRGQVMRRSKRMVEIEKCRCGYPLQGLDLARCPECGRVIHFDATPEDLGLTEEQLRRVQEKRNERSL